MGDLRRETKQKRFYIFMCLLQVNRLCTYSENPICSVVLDYIIVF